MLPDTSRTEREAFFSRLQRHPAFLLRHARALTGAVLRRLRTRLRLRLAGTHQGSKLRPPWLDIEALAAATGATGVTGALMLPPYPDGTAVKSCAAVLASPLTSDSADPEDYLAAHRWGTLTQSLLAGMADREERLRECLRWADSHTDKADPAWEPYSACERVANLLVYLAAAQSRGYAQSLPAGLRRFVQDSLGWILRHVEYYGPRQTNNHILNNARAIVMAASALGESQALAAGMQIFRQFLPRLIMDGGFLRERSSHYQIIVLNWVLDAWWFLGVAGSASESDRSFLGDYLQRMIAASAIVCARGTTLLALVGDVSPDLTPAQSLARMKLLYPDLWPAAQQSPLAAQLTDGWFRVVAGESVLVGNFPAGPFPAAFPTHGHSDLTGFAWLRAGREVLVDRGRYRYAADAISRFQSCAAGHNVPLVNGFAPLCESLVSQGHWWPLPYAAAQLTACTDHGSVTLVHDGFARATPVARHARRVSLEPEALVVVDSFDGAGTVELAFCWHFGDGFETFDAEHLTVSAPDASVTLRVEGAAGAPRAELMDAQSCGWMSRAYGERQPALGVCLRWRVPLPARIATRFSCAARV
jgi:Heparinase II/III-like protein